MTFAVINCQQEGYMAKKIFLVLTLSALTVGLVFAQTEETEQIEQTEQTEQTKQTKQTDFDGMAKNTITVDIGPTIMGALFGATGDIAEKMLPGDLHLTTSGFGIGAQYERQLARKLSVAGRFSYLGGTAGFEYSDKYVDTTTYPPLTINVPYKANLGIDISSFSIEGHARFYPLGKTFFLDGMLGYANLTVSSPYKINGEQEVPGSGVVRINRSVTIDASQGFFLLGAKIGWRISFGKNGGFTFEPSLGYSLGIGSGDTVWDQLSSKLSKKIKETNPDVNIEVDNFSEAGKVFGYVQDYIFIGGPRLSLAFGWRF